LDDTSVLCNKITGITSRCIQYLFRLIQRVISIAGSVEISKNEAPTS
jgi:hypothetical protein